MCGPISAGWAAVRELPVRAGSGAGQGHGDSLRVVSLIRSQLVVG